MIVCLYLDSEWDNSIARAACVWFGVNWARDAGEGAQAGAHQDPHEPGEGPRGGELRPDR